MSSSRRPTRSATADTPPISQQEWRGSAAMSSISGVVVGLVTQVRPGELKATYPWLDEQHETDWVRIAAGMSGNGRGSFFMPELQDEVLLAFDQGNPRLPYVVASCGMART